jgi:hypothetical protein
MLIRANDDDVKNEYFDFLRMDFEIELTDDGEGDNDREEVLVERSDTKLADSPKWIKAWITSFEGWKIGPYSQLMS